MTTWFVTRHPGARKWAEQQGIEADQYVEHLNLEDIKPGDSVIGSLPVHHAAKLSAQGAKYIHLSVDIPSNARGQELTADDLNKYNARLESFTIQPDAPLQKTEKQGLCIHVVVATGENLPNLIPTRSKDLKADQVIILCSEPMKDSAGKLRYGLTNAGIKEHFIRIISGCPDHNLAEILSWANKQAKALSSESPGARFIVNLTGGNKLMTIAFQQAFRGLGDIIYCDTEKSRIEYLHPVGLTPKRLEVNLLRLENYLNVQGFTLRNKRTDIIGITKRQDITHLLANETPRIQYLIGQLNKACHFFKNNQTNKADIDIPQRLAERSITDKLVNAGLLVAYGNELRIPNDTSANYLGGGWLEEWCWAIGKELESGEKGRRLTSDRWGINLEVDPWDLRTIPGQNQHPLNELDAVFVHRNRMLIIECKSGQQISERGESQDILNKLEILGKHVGGRLDTKWLLTARNIQNNVAATKRAKRYGIRLIMPNELADLKSAIYRWMTQ